MRHQRHHTKAAGADSGKGDCDRQTHCHYRAEGNDENHNGEGKADHF